MHILVPDMPLACKGPFPQGRRTEDFELRQGPGAHTEGPAEINDRRWKGQQQGL